MGIVPFDTLKLAKGLESGGFTAEQATAAVEALADAASSANLATKDDLTISSDRLEMSIDRLAQRIELSEHKMVVRFGGMLVVAVGVLIGVLRYLPPATH